MPIPRRVRAEIEEAERLFFVVAPYKPANRVSAGGGEAEEGEDIDCSNCQSKRRWR